MGRYPFLAFAEKYLEKRKAFIAPSTYREWDRKVSYINRVLVELKKHKKVSTTSPEKLNSSDIAAFISWGGSKGIQPATMVKYVSLVEKVCNYANNPIIERMRAEGEKFPKTTPKDLRSLEESELDAISEAAKKIGGWYGEIARFIMAMYPYSGLRPSELRLAHIDDIDTKKWRIFVRHPKGEGKYARQRLAPILPPARQIVLDYLKAREGHLRELGKRSAVPLIPANHKDGAGFYSETRFRGIKENVRSMTPGLQFSLKTFRDTFCQMNIDRNPGNLSAVSVLMGHSTTKTTERHYGRMRTEYALDAIQKEWETPNAQKPLIEIRNQLPGYV